ncbi:hypothetical protein B0H67DRAFT_236755 [Lasiosphaeris hirsuta]|uniref:Uncharacterized protein n=1 Tax=Lasiosphaeris hirsuta TaxID=260670 RepID=A0AA40AG40_9PEZI|nr:hypothetical protein B0H67DRAFT_236755 [Lasiosphaeris hirsuta]
MVLPFPARVGLELKPRPVSVAELLTNGDKSPEIDVQFEWLHLPANNMRWVEILMARHYDACGSEEAWNRNLVLIPKLWAEQQHIPQGKKRHYAQSYASQLSIPSTGYATEPKVEISAASVTAPIKTKEADVAEKSEPKNRDGVKSGGRNGDVFTRCKVKADRS